jgi:protein-disulfide isomerase
MKHLYRSVVAPMLRMGIMAGIVFALPLAASAGDAASKAPPSVDYSPVLKIFKSQGVTINYLGRKYGLDGWLLLKDNKLQVLYVTPDGQGAVVGTMYGPDGNLVTGAQLDEAKSKGELPAGMADQIATPPSVPPLVGGAAAPQPVPQAAASAPAPAGKDGEAPSERLWKQVQSSTFIKFGSDKAPPLYVIMDPRCHYCHDLYVSLTGKYIANNAMQLRVIPVGILGDDSNKEAAQVVSSPDSANLWAKIEQYNVGDLPPVAPGANAKIEKNHDIMSDWNLTGTPSIIYRTKDGKVKVVLGVPQDIDAIVADLGPAQAH